MKKVIISAALLVSMISFAQKDELKTLKKIYDKDQPSAKDFTNYREAIAKAEPLASDEGDKIYLAYYKAITPILELSLPENMKNPAAAMSKINTEVIYDAATAGDKVLEYEKKSGKKVLTDDIVEMGKDPQSVSMLMNYAITLGNQKKEKEASKVLYSVYLMDKSNLDNLYYAASYAVNGQDYETAMQYYDILKKANYTGEKTIYQAKSKLSDKYENFGSKDERDKAVKLGSHTLPKQEQEPSKKGEIYKNIALILVQQGKEKEAFAAVEEARRENPQDIGIMVAQADLYMKMKDDVNYKKVVTEILAKEPNNAGLIYNLGVVAMDANQDKEAEEHFKKAISIKPDYADAYINLTAVRLKPDKAIVEQMNKLGTSAADNKKYDQLKAQREKMFRDLLPDLEKAYQLMPDNDIIAQNLMSVYGALEMTEKRNAIKAKLKK